MITLDIFEKVTDPRKQYLIKYELKSLIFITLSAVVSGCESFTEIADFAEYKRDWITKFVPLPEGKTPSHDIFGDLYSSLDPEEFGSAFVEWTSQLCHITAGQLIAIDGKRVRGSYDKYGNKAAIHMVSAWASENEIVLGQVKTDDKSNEITAIPSLLNLLAVKDSVVSIDAMGCQKDIASLIRKKKADYILALKGNQSTLKEQVEGAFNHIVPYSESGSTDKGHGRIEERKCTVITDFSLIEEAKKWKDLNSIIKIESKRTEVLTGKESQETRYYISSCSFDAEKFNQYIRNHWGIENKLHWILDVNFSEDKSRIRKGYADQNFSVIRRIALNMIRLEDSIKKSKKAKMKISAIDDLYREAVLKI